MTCSSPTAITGTASAGPIATRCVGAGRTDTAAEQTLAFVSELVAEQLSVAAIHRLYTDVTLPDLTTALARSFEITPTDRPSDASLAAMEHEGFLVLVVLTAGGDYRETPPVRPDPRAGRGLAGNRAGRRRRYGELPARAGGDAGRSGRRTRVRGCAIRPVARRDRTHRPRGTPDAAQIDLLHPEAQDGIRHPDVGLNGEISFSDALRHRALTARTPAYCGQGKSRSWRGT